MQLFLKTPPINEPLSLEEVKAYLKLSSDQEDDFVRMLMRTARAYVEGVIGRVLLKQEWLMKMKPLYPSSSPLVQWKGKELEIDLPYPPLLEVETVKTDTKDIPFTTEENKVKLSPSLWDKELSITYWAGYGETGASLPPDLKMAVLMATRFFYDNQKVDMSLVKPFKVLHVI